MLKYFNKRNKKGQGMLEYAVLIVIVIGALISIQQYMKRGFQGRFRTSIDDIGEQYDPRFASTNIVYELSSNTDTDMKTDAKSDGSGYWTNRIDKTRSSEGKKGWLDLGNY